MAMRYYAEGICHKERRFFEAFPNLIYDWFTPPDWGLTFVIDNNPHLCYQPRY
jgi:hypothetical protein